MREGTFDALDISDMARFLYGSASEMTGFPLIEFTVLDLPSIGDESVAVPLKV